MSMHDQPSTIRIWPPQPSWPRTIAHAAAWRKRRRKAVFASIKQIDAGVLNVGYVDEGPANGPVVILLHGWPYDIHSYVDVVPLLTKAGYRVIVPHLRGYGTRASSTRMPCATASRRRSPPTWSR
jgi:predicted alpha/beta-fold hydrolase